jgi:hypothetical protein
LFSQLAVFNQQLLDRCLLGAGPAASLADVMAIAIRWNPVQDRLIDEGIVNDYLRLLENFPRSQREVFAPANARPDEIDLSPCGDW